MRQGESGTIFEESVEGIFRFSVAGVEFGNASAEADGPVGLCVMMDALKFGAQIGEDFPDHGRGNEAMTQAAAILAMAQQVEGAFQKLCGFIVAVGRVFEPAVQSSIGAANEGGMGGPVESEVGEGICVVRKWRRHLGDHLYGIEPGDKGPKSRFFDGGTSGEFIDCTVMCAQGDDDFGKLGGGGDGMGWSGNLRSNPKRAIVGRFSTGRRNRFGSGVRRMGGQAPAKIQCGEAPTEGKGLGDEPGTVDDISAQA